MRQFAAGVRRRLGSVAAAAVIVAVAGCSGPASTASTASAPATLPATAAISASPVPSTLATASPSPSSTVSASPSPSRTASPTPPPPAAGTVRLQYDGNAQVLLTLSSGRRIYIDVCVPGILPPPTANDVLLTTHTHDDHFLPAFDESFPGQKLSVMAGTIKLDDIKITGIVASHAGPQPDGSDHIFVIETAGLRIAHFGDLGQLALTAKQMAVIGAPDVAISQTWNDLSGMDATNHKGLDEMQQVKPLLFIPTHHDDDTIGQFVKAWPSFYAKKNVITLSKATLPKTSTMLVMGDDAKYYARTFELQAGRW